MISVIISLSHCSFPPLVPGSPGLHSVVAEARSQDLILLVVRDLSNLPTVGVLKAKGQGSSDVMKQFLFNRFSVSSLVDVDKRTLSRLISVGFLVGVSTLISPSLEAVTLKK